MLKDLSLSNAFRYMFSPVIAYFYLYICNASLAKQVIASLGILGITISFLVLGSVIYLLYRPFVYNIIILRLQDICRLKSNNYRTFLKKRYSIGTYEAMLLWVQIRDKYFKDCYSEMMKITASGIHLSYLAGIIAIPFTIWRFMVSDFKPALLFLVITSIFLLGAFLYDRYYEDTELRFLYSLNDNKLDLFASKMLRNKLSTPIKENDA